MNTNGHEPFPSSYDLLPHPLPHPHPYLRPFVNIRVHSWPQIFFRQLSLSALRVLLIISVTQQMAALVAARVDRANMFATAHFPDGGNLPILLNRVVGNLFLRRLRRRSFLNVGALGVRGFAHQIYIAPEFILRVSIESAPFGERPILKFSFDLNRRSLLERSFSFRLIFFGRLPERFTIDRKSSRGDVEARGHCAIVTWTRQKMRSLTLLIPSTRIFRHDMRNIHRRYPVSINTSAPRGLTGVRSRVRWMMMAPTLRS
jgi:hypothetical protein